ncbi:hypothetical protein AAG570_010197 [Ranatra chinensis]|uniref:ERAP1-like C-terminal domain-containing protein n=1 Tax=Ranatra chinensis TaxID=642074 RepID=A0ABD0YLW0_9HEMI
MHRVLRGRSVPGAIRELVERSYPLVTLPDGEYRKKGRYSARRSRGQRLLSRRGGFKDGLRKLGRIPGDWGRAAMDTTGSRYSSPSGTLFVEDNLTFKRKGGCFVAKSSAMLALLAVVVLLVATALITRHLTKQQYEKENIDANEGYTGAKPLARLTTDVIPLHYKLMLEPYLDHAPEGKQSFQMTGRVKIILKTKKPVSSIEIHEAMDGIDYGMRTAFCVGVRHGDKSEAEFMFHTYVNLTSKPLEQSEILKALTCSTKPWVIKMLLTESIKNNSIFKTEDVKILWSSFSENFAAAEAAFEFFEGNWKNILARYMNNPDVMKTIISKVSSSLSSEHHLRKLVELRDNMKLDDRSGKWQLEKAIENLQFNADWRVTQMPSVISWLRWFNNDFNQ